MFDCTKKLFGDNNPYNEKECRYIKDIIQHNMKELVNDKIIDNDVNVLNYNELLRFIKEKTEITDAYKKIFQSCQKQVEKCLKLTT